MTEKKLNPEEPKLKVRRRLLKLAVYIIPAIATVLATEEAYAAPRKFKKTPTTAKTRNSGLS